MLELRPDVAVVGSIATSAAGAMLLLLTAPIPAFSAIALALAAGWVGCHAVQSQLFGRHRKAPRALLLSGGSDWMLEAADGSRQPLPVPLVAARVVRWWFLRWPGGWAVVTVRNTGKRSWRQLTARLREQAHGSVPPHTVSVRG